MRRLVTFICVASVATAATGSGQAVTRTRVLLDERFGGVSIKVSASTVDGIRIQAIDSHDAVAISGPCPQSLAAWTDSVRQVLSMPLLPAVGEELEARTPRVNSMGEMWFERTVTPRSSATRVVFTDRTYSVAMVPLSGPTLEQFLDAIVSAVKLQLEMSPPNSFARTCSAKFHSEADDLSVLESAVNASGLPGTDQVYFEFQVEKQAVPIRGTLSLKHPEMLRSARVEGEVLAQFVVDSTGSVDVASIKVLKSSHGLFSQAVRDALKSARFSPAEIGGRKVSQLVQQPFNFTLRR